MGRPIVYCGDCGTSLREQDFEKGRAREIDRRPFCADCRGPAPVLPVERPAPARISTASIPRVATTRRRGAPRASAMPLVAGGAVLALLVLVVVVASSPSPRLPEQTPVPPTPSGVAAPAAPLAPRPAPVAAPPPSPVVAPPAADASRAVDRWLEDVKEIRTQDPEFRRAEEVRTLLRKAAEIAGPRRAAVEALLADYEKAAAAPPPEPARAPALAPDRPPAPRVTATYTLIDADTDKPVPGFDPMPPGAVVDLARIGTRKIDVRINLSGKVASLRTVINGGKPHVENSPPFSFTENSVAGGFAGWTPTAGPQTLTVTPYAEKSGKGSAGDTLSFTFTVVDGGAPK